MGGSGPFHCTTCPLAGSRLSPSVPGPPCADSSNQPPTAWQALSYLLLFWFFNFLKSSNLLHYITAVTSMNRSEIGLHAGYCYTLPSRQTGGFSCLCWLFGVSPFRVSWAGAVGAWLSTLIPMTCFLCFYWADFIFSFYIGSVLTDDPTVWNIKYF